MAETTLEEAPQRARDLFHKGFTAFERGNLDYAIDLLSASVAAAPGLLQARKFLRAAEIRKFKQAGGGRFAHWTPMLAALPLYLKALAKLKSGKGGEVLAAAEELLRRDPLNPKFILLFVQAAVRANLPDVAIQTLEMARDHHPENIAMINWLGSLYQKVGRTRAARECFEKLCEICPNDPGALKSLKDAMALDSMSTDGWAQTAEAGGTYRDVMRDMKEAEILEQESKAVKSTEDLDALIADTLAKIEQEPENVNYLRALARLYAQKKQFRQSLDTVRKAIALSPGDPELDNLLSVIRLQQFDEEIARLREGGREAAAAEKEKEKKRFAFHNLQERVRRYPNDLKLRHDLGLALFEQDSLNEAIQQFQMAQRSPKHRISSLYYLGLSFKRKKQNDLAVEQLRKAASEITGMDAQKKEIYYELGGLFEAAGDWNQAADYYKQIYQVDIGYRDIAQKIETFYQQRRNG